MYPELLEFAEVILITKPSGVVHEVAPVEPPDHDAGDDEPMLYVTVSAQPTPKVRRAVNKKVRIFFILPK